MRLLERERELDVLTRAMTGIGHGQGVGVAVSGEAGAGKTSLVTAAGRRASAFRFLRGGCDPLATPRPLGPFRDLFPDLRSLESGALLASVCEATYDALRAEPTVLVVEDLHWVDAASVEVLRFLLRRLETAPYAIVVTYRDDDIGPRHSARPLLGDVAGLEQVVTVRLAPLSLDAVAALLGDAPLDAVDVHRVTGGNPFFVAEVAKDPGRPLPGTVRDAVLARTVELAPADLEVLQLAAAAPDHLDDRVLPALGVDLPTLRRLYDTGLLRRDSYGLVFRHELARLAVESTIPVGGAARLHGRLLAALESLEPRDPAVLTHHAVAAADSRRATVHAEEAAREAARSGSHTEAVAFLQIAVDHLGSGRLRERALLLTRLAEQQYLTSRLDKAIAGVTATFPLWREVGDMAGLSAAHSACAVYEYYNARRRQAEDHAERAAALVSEQLGLEYGDARATRGYLAYHRSDYGLTEECRADAARIADEVGDEPLGLRSLVVGAVTALALGEPGARERCVSIIETARAAGLDELASTGYSNLVYLDVEQRRLAAAERVLEESLSFALDRDIPICHHWQTGVRSRLRFLEGRWKASLEDAADALDRSGMPLATVWPHLVSAQIAMRRGEDGDAHLEAAWELAEELDEPLRRLPVLAALAERTWLTGTEDARVTTTAPEELHRVERSPATMWSAGDLAVWLSRLGLDARSSAGRLAEPHLLGLAGRHEEAAGWWGRTGAVFEAAMADVDASSVDRRMAGIERLDLLGATATADRVRRRLREEGVVNVPPRPRASSRANPAGLTNRQLDVARLMGRGLTNAEIAHRLFISPKTTDHHVSAVLTKLGMPNRRAVVVQADQLGLS